MMSDDSGMRHLRPSASSSECLTNATDSKGRLSIRSKFSNELLQLINYAHCAIM
ncbi:MAG: hypothetical protein JWO18_2075 [Microbacteriaceae bacterium]|jgi:hypothetical protein|nr:hypothetical protein [Microbacteriaceae bacterium]